MLQKNPKLLKRLHKMLFLFFLTEAKQNRLLEYNEQKGSDLRQSSK